MKENRDIIGTLNEQTLHLALKNYFDSDPSHHEIKYKGFVADIINENGIIEIETVSFSRLKKKLATFLTDRKVTVVFPVAQKTEYVLYDANNNFVKSGKSTKKGRPTDIFHELMKITDFVDNKNLSFKIILFEMLEYRHTTKFRGRRNTTRFERIPKTITGVIDLKGSHDFENLVTYPAENFTAKEFAKANGMRTYPAWEALTALVDLGLLNCNKEKREFIYYTIDKLFV